MGVRKGTVVSFLPCLVVFWGFHPYMSSFVKMFFVTCFSCFLVGRGYRAIDPLLRMYRTLGRIMTGYSIRRLRIYAVLITWGNYNRGVIYDEVKNTVVQ